MAGSGAAARAGRILLAVAVLVVLGNPVLLYFMQERLLFFPQPVNESNRKLIRAKFGTVEEVVVPAADGRRLHGWYQRAATTPAPLILYFGGNDEDISYLPAARDRVPGWSMLAVNYRGYGGSEGEPGEAALFRDALAIHDHFARRSEVDPRRIVAMGRSLGSGVATYLAAQRPLHAAILVTPYDSVADVAGDKFWFAPVSLILKHRFDSAALAPGIRRPALFLVAEEDESIPLKHSKRLYDAWGGPKRWHLVARENHGTIEHAPGYWPTIGEFLASAGSPSP